jgi:hypothetical protein
VLGDVTVRHPAAGIGDREQDVDRLAGEHEHGVLPHEVVVRLSVSREDEESAGAVQRPASACSRAAYPGLSGDKRPGAERRPIASRAISKTHPSNAARVVEK